MEEAALSAANSAAMISAAAQTGSCRRYEMSPKFPPAARAPRENKSQDAARRETSLSIVKAELDGVLFIECFL